MSLGEVNKGVIVLILVLVLGAGGYLWYSQMYTPAVEARVAAKAQADTAQQGLDAAKAELTKAQETLEQQNDKAKEANDAVARLQLARQTVPAKALVDDSNLVIGSVADRTGVELAYKELGDVTNTAGAEAVATVEGARPIDLKYIGAGEVPEMLAFMRQVEDSVRVKKDKLYPTGRLFNVVSLELIIEEVDEDVSSGAFGDTESTEDLDLPPMGPNDYLFTVVIRTYVSSTENNQGVGAAAGAAVDPATAGAADPASGAAIDPATGAAPTTTPEATSTMPDAAGTDPNAAPSASSSPPIDGAAGAGATAGAPTSTPVGAAS